MKTITATLFFLLVMARFGFSDANIKEPNVAGQFYSDNPDQLSTEIDGYLNKAEAPAVDQSIELLIAPHAGYMYSGGVAGFSFKAVQTKKYQTIVILAPSHYVPFDGASVWTEGGFKTPLGIVPVDTEFSKKLLASHPKFSSTPSVFEREHSLEVEIPFLQKTFQDFKIVPVIMGQPNLQSVEEMAKALSRLVGQRKDVLIVVSSDMSHYHTYDVASQMDHATLETIEKLDAGRLWSLCQLRKLEMCGFVPVTAALFYAKERGLTAKTLKYANSGDVTGDKDRVVGYSSVIMYASAEKTSPKPDGENKSGVAPLTKEQKKNLLDVAGKTIKMYVETGKTFPVNTQDPRLNEMEGAFVTIHKEGRLRGCIGHIIGDKPLIETVRDMAIAAASQDPRFDPVAKDELAKLDVEVSVLSKPWIISTVNEIEMGKHGVIISQGAHQGLFLPQVATETGWSKEEFLAQLCSQKAGLPPNCWKDPRTRIRIFSADVFSAKDVE